MVANYQSKGFWELPFSACARGQVCMGFRGSKISIAERVGL